MRRICCVFADDDSSAGEAAGGTAGEPTLDEVTGEEPTEVSEGTGVSSVGLCQGEK